MKRGLAGGDLVHELAVALPVIPEKSLAVLEHCAGRLPGVVERIVRLAQIVLKNPDPCTQRRERLAVLRLAHAELLRKQLRGSNHISVGRVHRGQPLSEQGNLAVTLQRSQVRLKLLLQQRNRQRMQGRVQQKQKVVPAAVLRNQPEIAGKAGRAVLRQVTQQHAEHTPLAEAAAHIAGIKEHLHGELSVLGKGTQEALLDFRLILRTQRADGGKKVQDIRTGAPGGDRTVLGEGPVRRLLHILQHENQLLSSFLHADQ